MAERMIRLSKKWEAEHQLWEERERQNEAEMKAKEMELLASDKKCLVKALANNNGRIERGSQKGEMNMDNFLKKERQLMLTRLKPKEKKFIPFTKDLRVVDAKFVSIWITYIYICYICPSPLTFSIFNCFIFRRRMSEVSIQKLKLIVAKVRGTVDDGDNNSQDATASTDIEDAIPVNFKSTRRNTKARCDLMWFPSIFNDDFFSITGNGNV